MPKITLVNLLKASNIVTLMIGASLMGCAGSPLDNDVADERFITEIKTDGSKLFTYGLSFDLGDNAKGDRNNSAAERDRQRGDGERGAGGQRSGNGRGQNQGNESMPSGLGRGNNRFSDNRQDMLETLYTRLELKLVKNGFCREGYFELDRYTGRNTAQIKGECNESASEKDKEKFTK
ncbi:hypothetical protein QX776_16675 [Alteromonadaceae bacterium BrNp21-10]|nr:hypothetical protein [Alteromonadaceae bacterium BrNp21-10]